MSRLRWLVAAILLVVLVLPASCTVPEEPTGTGAVVEETGGETIAEQPATEGLGSPAEPLVMSFVPSGDQSQIVTGGEQIAALLGAETGLAIEANVATSYAAVIEAMGAGNAHIAWLNTFNYLLAHEKYDVQPLLVTERYGSTSYAGQIIARADSGITTLADLAGRKFCRPDALSTSGWIIPKIMLQAAGVMEADLGDIVDATGHDGVVELVYNGDCDAGATFVDARDDVVDTYPDVKDVVVVLDVSDDIPNDNVSVLASLAPAMVEQIKNGLLTISMTAEGQEALQTTYGIENLQLVDDTFYDDFRATLDKAGVDIEELARE